MKKIKIKFLTIIIILCAIIYKSNTNIYAATSGAVKADTLYVGVGDHDVVYGRPAL